ncbi:unnamed protein product [Caretta caretta]
MTQCCLRAAEPGIMDRDSCYANSSDKTADSAAHKRNFKDHRRFQGIRIWPIGINKGYACNEISSASQLECEWQESANHQRSTRLTD